MAGGGSVMGVINISDGQRLSGLVDIGSQKRINGAYYADGNGNISKIFRAVSGVPKLIGELSPKSIGVPDDFLLSCMTKANNRRYFGFQSGITGTQPGPYGGGVIATAEDGTNVWTSSLGKDVIKVVTTEDLIFALTSDASAGLKEKSLFCLSKDGEHVWEQKITNCETYGDDMVVYENYVYMLYKVSVGSFISQHHLRKYAFDGTLVWEKEVGTTSDIYSQIIIGDFGIWINSKIYDFDGEVSSSTFDIGGNCVVMEDGVVFTKDDYSSPSSQYTQYLTKNDFDGNLIWEIGFKMPLLQSGGLSTDSNGFFYVRGATSISKYSKSKLLWTSEDFVFSGVQKLYDSFVDESNRLYLVIGDKVQIYK